MSRCILCLVPRLACAALFLAGCIGLAGCQGKASAPVSGKVTYQGRPVTSGVVVLIGPDGKTSSPGLVRPDGTFTIPNAPVGTVKVSFDNPPPPRVTSAPGAPRGGAAAQEEQENAAQARLYVPTPLQYKDPNRSGVTLTVKRGKNDGCDIALK
jgi:hypothetical protein